MESVIQYVARFQPDFPSLVRGADVSRIAVFERLAGRPCPASYRDFLTRMGVDYAGIDPSVDGSADIEELIAYYQNEVRSGECPVPDGCVVIGVGAVTVPTVALDCRHEGEPPVVFTNGARVAGLVAKSLEGYLHQIAFGKYPLRSFHTSAFFAASFADLGRQHRLAAARKIAETSSFRALWFSDEITFCGERPDALIKMNQYEEQGLGITIAARDLDFIQRLGPTLVERLRVRPIAGAR